MFRKLKAALKQRRREKSIANALRLNQQGVLKLKNKNEPINVAFIVLREAVWKLDSVYIHMMVSERYNPTIVIAPLKKLPDAERQMNINKAYDWFASRGYQVVKGEENGRQINVRTSLSPDLIFYTNPHNDTNSRFYPSGLIGIPSVYVPYAHQISCYNNYQPQYNQLFHNLMWRIYTTNDLDKKIFEDFSDLKGSNVVVTGYPGIEPLITSQLEDKVSVWKTQDKSKKRIIWAPHHTIFPGSSLGYSTFIANAQFMKALAIKFADQVQFAFKPHPMLYDKLTQHPEWGAKKAQEYYDFWKDMENTQLEQADYLVLFYQSDAIVHDSGSFLAEYLYVNKPAMYLSSSQELELDSYNPFGKACLEQYEIGVTKADIEAFVQRVILNEDKYLSVRTEFLKEVLLPKQLPSIQIMDDLNRSLFG